WVVSRQSQSDFLNQRRVPGGVVSRRTLSDFLNHRATKDPVFAHQEHAVRASRMHGSRIKKALPR
ncbi:hypothetical protein, partial [Nocardioides sp. Root151]|uniref:hypothetical protein n=1 Tax=Nocardioides sp. Root151 TaxID=1736475 RepID=UPI001F16C9F6